MSGMMDDLLLLLFGVCASCLGAWLNERWHEQEARRKAEAIMAAEGWQKCGLGAFGLAPALAADNLPNLPPAAPEPESEPACARRYCPLCGGTPPGIAWLCGYHLARVRPARSVVLALPPIVAHPDGLTHDDLN